MYLPFILLYILFSCTNFKVDFRSTWYTYVAYAFFLIHYILLRPFTIAYFKAVRLSTLYTSCSVLLFIFPADIMHIKQCMDTNVYIISCCYCCCYYGIWTVVFLGAPVNILTAVCVYLGFSFNSSCHLSDIWWHNFSITPYVWRSILFFFLCKNMA